MKTLNLKDFSLHLKMVDRRLLLLMAALLLVQFGGLLHGLSHLWEDPHDHGNTPHTACVWCIAYADLDQGMGSSAPNLLNLLFENYFSVTLRTLFCPASRCSAYRSRAPPVLLVQSA